MSFSWPKQVQAVELGDLNTLIQDCNTVTVFTKDSSSPAKKRVTHYWSGSTTLSVAEIAYELGFERPQSFNKLFKNKTNRTPLEFRASFN